MLKQILTDEEFEALLARYDEALRLYCMRLTGETARAEDLWQEAKLTAWSRRASFEGRSSFRTWLFGIAKYTWFNQVRRKSEVLTDDGVLDADEPGLGVLGGLSREERQNFVLASVAACLDPIEQEVAFLRYSEGLPLDQITEVVDIQMGSGTRGVLQRLKRKLGREMRHRLTEMGHGSSFVRTNW